MTMRDAKHPLDSKILLENPACSVMYLLLNVRKQGPVSANEIK